MPPALNSPVFCLIVRIVIVVELLLFGHVDCWSMYLHTRNNLLSLSKLKVIVNGYASSLTTSLLYIDTRLLVGTRGCPSYQPLDPFIVKQKMM